MSEGVTPLVRLEFTYPGDGQADWILLPLCDLLLLLGHIFIDPRMQ